MTAHDKSPDFVYPLHIIDILDDFAILTVQMASALLRRKVEEQEKTQGKSALSFFFNISKSSSEI